MAKKKLRIGVVGMRGIGNVHADAHSKDELADLTAVCDVIKDRADAAAQKYGVKAYYSLRDMLRNEELDVVDVTTGGFENGSYGSAGGRQERAVRKAHFQQHL